MIPSAANPFSNFGRLYADMSGIAVALERLTSINQTLTLPSPSVAVFPNAGSTPYSDLSSYLASGYYSDTQAWRMPIITQSRSLFVAPTLLSAIPADVALAAKDTEGLSTSAPVLALNNDGSVRTLTASEIEQNRLAEAAASASSSSVAVAKAHPLRPPAAVEEERIAEPDSAFWQALLGSQSGDAFVDEEAETQAQAALQRQQDAYQAGYASYDLEAQYRQSMKLHGEQSQDFLAKTYREQMLWAIKAQTMAAEDRAADQASTGVGALYEATIGQAAQAYSDALGSAGIELSKEDFELISGLRFVKQTGEGLERTSKSLARGDNWTKTLQTAYQGSVGNYTKVAADATGVDQQMIDAIVITVAVSAATGGVGASAGPILGAAIGGAVSAMASSAAMQVYAGGDPFSNDQMWQAGVTGAASGAIGGAIGKPDSVYSAAASGAVTNTATAAMSKILQGKSMFSDDDLWKSAVAGAVTGAVNYGYRGSSGFTRYSKVLADSAVGCASGALLNNDCRSGATTAAIVSGLDAASYAMRQMTAADSKKFEGVKDKDGNTVLDNKGRPSQGIGGDGKDYSGERVAPHEICNNDMCVKGVSADGTGNGYYQSDGSIKLNEGVTLTQNSDGTVSVSRAADGGGTITNTSIGGPTGGIQGASVARLGSIAVESDSFLGKTMNAYSGSHDLTGGAWTDDHGNLKEFKPTDIKWLDAGLEYGISSAGVIGATPFAAATLLNEYNINPVVLSNSYQKYADSIKENNRNRSADYKFSTSLSGSVSSAPLKYSLDTSAMVVGTKPESFPALLRATRPTDSLQE